MNPQVLLQIHARSEALVASVIPERLLPSVDPQMQLQIVAPVESPSAKLARERLLGGVDNHVFVQITLLPEQFSTVAALKSLPDGVRLHVRFVVFEIRHHLTALVTPVRVAVGILLLVVSLNLFFAFALTVPPGSSVPEISSRN